jgi:hypothetical protein
MAELIAKIVFGGSLIGIGTILVRKVPLLVEMPEEEEEGIDWKAPIFKLLKWFTRRLKVLSPGVYLEKVFSGVKKITLIADRKTEGKIQEFREEFKKNKRRRNDNYWEKLKRAKEEDNEDLPA